MFSWPISCPTCVIFASSRIRAQVWDVVGGGRLLHSLSNHQKTVTCLCLDGTGSRLLSGGLDRHVKIYNLQNFKVKFIRHDNACAFEGGGVADWDG